MRQQCASIVYSAGVPSGISSSSMACRFAASHRHETGHFLFCLGVVGHFVHVMPCASLYGHFIENMPELGPSSWMHHICVHLKGTLHVHSPGQLMTESTQLLSTLPPIHCLCAQANVHASALRGYQQSQQHHLTGPCQA